MCCVSSICNLLLENPEYPRGDTAAATAAPTSILLESGDTQTEVCVCIKPTRAVIPNQGYLYPSWYFYMERL